MISKDKDKREEREDRKVWWPLASGKILLYKMMRASHSRVVNLCVGRFFTYIFRNFFGVQIG